MFESCIKLLVIYMFLKFYWSCTYSFPFAYTWLRP